MGLLAHTQEYWILEWAHVVEYMAGELEDSHTVDTGRRLPVVAEVHCDDMVV